MTEKGFTMVELLIIMIILGVIAAVGTVSLSSSTSNYIVTTATEQLLQELRTTRSEALARNETMEFALDGDTYVIRDSGGNIIKNRIILGWRVGDVNLTFQNLGGASRVLFTNRGLVGNPAGNPIIVVSRGGTTREVHIQRNTGYMQVVVP